MGQDWEGLSHEGAGRATRPSDPRIGLQRAQAQMKNLKKENGGEFAHRHSLNYWAF